MSAEPSRALLSTLSAELFAMMDTVESLSDMVADHVRDSQGDARVRALVGAQAIDLLGQRLDALGNVTGAMARGDDVETVLAGIRLSALAQRLRGDFAAVPPAPVARPVAGDLMLFE